MSEILPPSNVRLSLLIPDRPWQHLSMDFHSLPKDKAGYDAALIIVDCLSKRPITIPCHRDVNAQETARLFIEYVRHYYGPPDTIVSDRGPQSVSV